VRVPMDCWRQWIRHRTANINEYSTRYSLAIDSAQGTSQEQWRRQSSANRQGSEEAIDAAVGQDLSERERQLQTLAREVYEERIAAGVAREQARKDLPVSTYTEAYWKIDLHNLFNFLALRMDAHAQEEIRRYATVIGEQVVATWCPLAWEAFVDYSLESLVLSKIEREIIALIGGGHTADAIAQAQALGKRERNELEAKLTTLAIAVPWAT